MSISDEIKTIKNSAALKVYELISKDWSSKLEHDFISDGITLHRLISPDNPEIILKLLNKLSLPPHYTLGLQKDFWEDFGQYNIIVNLPDSTISKDIFKFLNIENSLAGAWQAYLLYSLWHILPLNDHSNYYRRQFIFFQNSFADICIDENDKDIKRELENINTKLSIIGCNKFYYVSYYYWCLYGGLYHSINEVQIENNRVLDINEIYRKNILEYGKDLRI